MDPDVALRKIRELTRLIHSDAFDDLEEMIEQVTVAVELAETIDGLDNWLTHGGFLPGAWRRD